MCYNRGMGKKTILAVAQAALVSAAVAGVADIAGAQFPVHVLYARGGVAAAEDGMRTGDGKSVTLAWKSGGEQPVVAYDYGGRTVGGYAVFNVTGFKAQGKDADGKTVGWPVLRLSYSTHPDGLRATGDFTRRGCADYLGQFFDNPVLPANVNRYELYTVTRTGTFVAPLLQGQERYVRVQLDTPGTEVAVDAFEIRNTGVFSREAPVGSFRCSDERVNRAWDTSAWTCRLASFPNHDAWRVVDGKLLPRKLEHGTEVGLCSGQTHAGNGTWSMDFELRTNPNFPSAAGMMLRAQGVDDGVVVAAMQPAFLQIVRRRKGANEVLCRKVLDEPIIDGVRCRLEAKVSGKNVAAWFNGVKIANVDVPDLGSGGRFGIYTEKEWWPVVYGYSVKDGEGRELFREDFSKADDEGRLSGWDYTRSFQFMADGAKRDRLVWIGDLWWAQRTCFAAFRPEWPYFRESLKLLAYNQTPEGYVWAAPYAEKGRRPGPGEYGHFPSDEFSAWLVPITWDYYLHTADAKTMETLYPAVKRDLEYLTGHCGEDGIFRQRVETSSHAWCMPPKDPRTRAYMNLVLWLGYRDGAKLARALGHEEDAAGWERLADQLAKAIRSRFWSAERQDFDAVLGQPGSNIKVRGMALASGFATDAEALAIAPKIAVGSGDKFHLLALRGKFAYGFDQAAFDMLEGGTWFKLSDPGWEGAQCCTECGFLTRDGWWDESHPDTTVAGPITTYLLGVGPTEPGFVRFRFAPHVIAHLSHAEGRVPTPHGFVEARWERAGDTVKASLAVPEGTTAEVGFLRASKVMVDGKPHAGGALGPGRHEIVAEGMDEHALEDKSLAAGLSVKSGEQWLSVVPSLWNWDGSPDCEFVQKIDLGAVCDVQAVEFAAEKMVWFPSEVRVDVSSDGVAWTQQRELTGLKWPGAGKGLLVDLRTVGSALPARLVRLRFRRPPRMKSSYDDIAYYLVRLSSLRVKCSREARGPELDFRGCFPKEIRTVALVMPASIQPKARFDRGKAALEAAGYKVKVMPRLNFGKVAPVEDRVADFEQAWMDPEVDLVLCARGGTGAEDLLPKLDWAKLRTRRQRVLGFSNITMILNAMLKEKAGRPYSGSTLSQFLYAKPETFEWLAKALAEGGAMPEVKLTPLRAGACKGPACGGHVSLVLKGVKMGWAADTKGRIVFLECVSRPPAEVRKMLDELVDSGYFRDCAGVVFGDLTPSGPNRTKLKGEAFKVVRDEMARIRRDFAAKVGCPVFEGYPYGHIPKSFAIDFLREKTISADGVMKQ